MATHKWEGNGALNVHTPGWVLAEVSYDARKNEQRRMQARLYSAQHHGGPPPPWRAGDRVVICWGGAKPIETVVEHMSACQNADGSMEAQVTLVEMGAAVPTLASPQEQARGPKSAGAGSRAHHRGAAEDLGHGPFTRAAKSMAELGSVTAKTMTSFEQAMAEMGGAIAKSMSQAGVGGYHRKKVTAKDLSMAWESPNFIPDNCRPCMKRQRERVATTVVDIGGEVVPMCEECSKKWIVMGYESRESRQAIEHAMRTRADREAEAKRKAELEARAKRARELAETERERLRRKEAQAEAHRAEQARRHRRQPPRRATRR